MNTGLLEDDVVSMVDVLQEDNELEEEARAVLGDSDDQHCTYPSGYVKRQALYACGTCLPSDSEPAGVCLACSLACHDGHVIYELYTKRNFRCDCGNKKFSDFKCKLFAQKDAENAKNKYNQNFKGVYCTCHRPYPDLEDEIEDEMIQCIICEDWYHSRHLGNLPPAEGDFQEMICDDCMTKCNFLQAYLALSVTQNDQSSFGTSQQLVTNSEKETAPKVEKPSEAQVGRNVDRKEIKSADANNKQEDMTAQEDSSGTRVNDSPKAQSSDQPGSVTSARKKNIKEEEEDEKGEEEEVNPEKKTFDCKLAQLQENVKKVENEATYWHIGWRSALCKCKRCLSLYRSMDLMFLTDDTDTILAYEQRGRENKPTVSSYESGIQALQNMGRIPQVEVIQEYNDMKSELTEYLREFVAQGKVVKEEDIRNFFDTLQSRKRQRIGSANSVQYSCR